MFPTSKSPARMRIEISDSVNRMQNESLIDRIEQPALNRRLLTSINSGSNKDFNIAEQRKRLDQLEGLIDTSFVQEKKRIKFEGSSEFFAGPAYKKIMKMRRLADTLGKSYKPAAQYGKYEQRDTRLKASSSAPKLQVY